MANSNKVNTIKAYSLSTVSVTLVLFIIGLASTLLLVTNILTDGMLKNVKVSVMLKDDITKEVLHTLQDTLQNSEGCSNVVYISKDQAVEDFNAYIGEDFVMNIGSNPLPASLEVYLSKDKPTSEIMNKIEPIFKEYDESILEIVQQGAMLQQALKNINLFKIVVFSFLIALLLVSIITINNTIRMVVLSKRFLLKTMMLVGATNGFIRRPFLKNAFWQGVLSAFFASLLLLLAGYGVYSFIPELILPVIEDMNIYIIPATLVVLGILICFFSTFFAVNKYLRLNNDELYIY